jgi:glucose-6-phosphate isomerase
MLNAKSVKQWLVSEYSKVGISDEALIAEKHICACSTNIAETSKFGISKDNVFGFWDFVGGRFSVWSAIGVLPLSIHFGF